MRARDTVTLPEGQVVLEYPVKLSKESFADVEKWLDRKSVV